MICAGLSSLDVGCIDPDDDDDDDEVDDVGNADAAAQARVVAFVL